MKWEKGRDRNGLDWRVVWGIRAVNIFRFPSSFVFRSHFQFFVLRLALNQNRSKKPKTFPRRKSAPQDKPPKVPNVRRSAVMGGGAGPRNISGPEWIHVLSTVQAHLPRDTLMGLIMGFFCSREGKMSTWYHDVIQSEDGDCPRVLSWEPVSPPFVFCFLLHNYNLEKFRKCCGPRVLVNNCGPLQKNK